MTNEQGGEPSSGRWRKSVYRTTDDDKYVDNEYSNVSTDFIRITHDKLENILLKSYQKHLLRYAWFNPLSILLALGLSIATSDFKPTAFGLDAATWRAFFMFIFTAACIWLVWSLILLARNWKESSIESLIKRIKNVTA
jgi:hypothetical protein